ncbi:MAG TPA: DUF397 domain-containing protein [Actinoplanes sp.]
MGEERAPDSDLDWRRASACGITGGCVEIAQRWEMVVRDSKNPEGPVLRYTQAEWAAFVDGVKNGEFDSWL